jgi:hypothetical protein
MPSIYEANPLDAASGEIQLLNLLPGRRDHQLCLSFHIMTLYDSAFYTAASYMWGTASATREILLDGEPFLIRENLWKFLCELRARSAVSQREAENRPDMLWLDAICINQDDIEERNQQVAMMEEIYPNAEEVAVWLGSEADNSTLAMKAFETRETREQWSTEEGRAMLELFNRTYWRRVWIVQEFVLAQKLTINCGKKHVSGQDLVSLVRTTEYTVNH